MMDDGASRSSGNLITKSGRGVQRVRFCRRREACVLSQRGG